MGNITNIVIIGLSFVSLPCLYFLAITENNKDYKKEWYVIFLVQVFVFLTSLSFYFFDIF